MSLSNQVLYYVDYGSLMLLLKSFNALHRKAFIIFCSLFFCATFSSSLSPFMCSQSTLRRMMWRMRSRSRTICLSLAFITVFLYLLLALVSLPIHQQPCDPLLPPKTHILQDLARTNYTSVGMNDPADTTRRDSSNKDARKDARGHVGTPADMFLSVKEGENALRNMPVGAGHHGTSRTESVESGLSKLKALFDHPLYNLPSYSVPEEDWLLKVKPKVKASEKSSQMWYNTVQKPLCVCVCVCVCAWFLISLFTSSLIIFTDQIPSSNCLLLVFALVML